MPWVKFDDQYPQHPKIGPLSDRLYRLHNTAIFWSSRHTTDGVIRAELLTQVRAKAKAADATELVRRRLFHGADDPPCPSPLCPPPGPDGWVIHDYWDYQPTRAKVIRERTARASRQARWRARRAGLSSERVDPLVVFERDGWICQLCNGPVDRNPIKGTDPKTPVLDHIKPEALGGTYTYDNVQTAHHRCNSRKRHSYDGVDDARSNGVGDASTSVLPTPPPPPPRPEGSGAGRPERPPAAAADAVAGDGGGPTSTTAGGEEPTPNHAHTCPTCGNRTSSAYHRNTCARSEQLAGERW